MFVLLFGLDTYETTDDVETVLDFLLEIFDVVVKYCEIRVAGPGFLELFVDIAREFEAFMSGLVVLESVVLLSAICGSDHMDYAFIAHVS